MLMQWLMGLEKVHQARTQEEREAIYRFRYHIYVEELEKGFLDVDHERRMIYDEDDVSEGAVLFYTQSKGEITGTVRAVVWRPGEAPDAIRERFSFDIFPGVASLTTAETSRLLIDRSVRGSLVLPALARAMYEYMIGQDVALVFAYCAPGLVRAYRKLGYRPYAGELICNQDGVRVPLVGVLSDLDYLQRVGSPVAPLVKQFFGPGKREFLDLRPFRDVLDPGPLPFEVEPEVVWNQLQEQLLNEVDQEYRAKTLLDTLPEPSIRKLASKGFIMDVPADRTVVRQDLVEKEMFFILEGAFVVEAGDRVLAHLHRGDVFGEIALLVDEGRRTATIRSLTEGRVLVLRRRFLEEIMQDDPALSSRILFNLSRILAERMAGMLSEV
jgi:N-acyl-L-homoserine lactone synthetase